MTVKFFLFIQIGMFFGSIFAITYTTTAFTTISSFNDDYDCILNKERCVNGICMNLINSSRCDCYDGYTGVMCDTALEAICTKELSAPNECQKDSFCYEAPRCVYCNESVYHLQINDTDSLCPLLQGCFLTGCKNGGICVKATISCQNGDCDNGGVCKCLNGFSGTNCEFTKNVKVTNCSWCINGDCELYNSQKCNCHSNWYGDACDKSIAVLVVAIVVPLVLIAIAIAASVVIYINRSKLPCNSKQPKNTVDKASEEKRYVNSFDNPIGKPSSNPPPQPPPPPKPTSQIPSKTYLNYIDTLNPDETYYYPQVA